MSLDTSSRRNEGDDEGNITNPTLSYEDRRPRMPMPDFVDNGAEENAADMSDDYSPTDSESNEADDEASDGAEDALSDGSVSGGDESQDYGLPVPRPSPRKSARASHLQFSFSELQALPKLTSSEESESFKEESGPDSSPRPIKEEDAGTSGVTNAINTTYMIGRVSTEARHTNQFQARWSTSKSDDTDPDLVEGDIKIEDGVGSLVPTPRPVSNSPSFLNDTSHNENMRREASGEDQEMRLRASPSPIAEEPEEERVKGPKGKEVIVISSSSSDHLPQIPKAKKRVGKKFLNWQKKAAKSVWDITSSSDSSPPAKEENAMSSKQTSRANPKSKLAEKVKKLYVKKLKKMRRSRDRELKRGATKTANANMAGRHRGQGTTATAPNSAVSGSPANPAGVVKRTPGRPVGSGLLSDKKLLEPTRLSKRLRRHPRSTSPRIFQVSRDNTAKLKQATESPLKRKRGRPVGSTEAYLLARELQADVVKNEHPSLAEGSPSKGRRTDKQ